MQIKKKSKTIEDMPKCDVIIPIFNAPDWLKLCVYSLFVNTPTDYLGTVFLLDDCSNDMTKNCINNLERKYHKYIKVISNDKNIGFVKNVNNGLKLSSSEYVLLLNTDCLISPNTIPKLINHMKVDSKIGLICPISSNAANLTLEMFDGFSYTQMDNLLEKKFLGKDFDACTIVGNCLMISRDCIQKVGFLDEAYGLGYGEETDYQFKAMSKGFSAKVVIDTYVFHKSEASFGVSPKKKERVEKNRSLFFERWGKEYEKEAEKYSKNDPIQFIKDNLDDSDYEITADSLFFLPQITQNAGGCHVVFDIVNYMVINGRSANVMYEKIYDYQEIMLFNPIKFSNDVQLETKQIIATIWFSTLKVRLLAQRLHVPIINLVQGYENYFENGHIYNSVALTHKVADYDIVISEYLEKKLKAMFNVDAQIIKNGINCDLIYKNKVSNKVCSITFVMRNNMMKGDYILADIIHTIDKRFKNLSINVVYMSENIEIPFVKNNKLRKILGPISRIEMINLLQETDVYVDASVNEGFGLIGLESMASGAVPVMSNSFGVLSYLKDGENGYVIDRVNDSDKYVEKIEYLINNPAIFKKLQEKAQKTALSFDYNRTIEEYINYFDDFHKRTIKTKRYTKEEWEIINGRDYKSVIESLSKPKGLKVVKLLSNLVPNFIKDLIKELITWAYKTYDHP